MNLDKRTLRIVIGAALVIVGFFVIRSMTQSPAATTARPAARPQRGATPEADLTPPDVNLEQLRGERGEPVDRGRNPFRFRPKPAPPPPPAPPADPSPPAPGNQTGGGFFTNFPQPSPPAGPPPPAPITLKLIGIVTKADGTRIAVLSDGQTPFSGPEGANIEGRYQILSIGRESIDIAYLDGRGRTTLRLPPPQ